MIIINAWNRKPKRNYYIVRSLRKKSKVPNRMKLFNVLRSKCTKIMKKQKIRQVLISMSKSIQIVNYLIVKLQMKIPLKKHLNIFILKCLKLFHSYQGVLLQFKNYIGNTYGMKKKEDIRKYFNSKVVGQAKCLTYFCAHQRFKRNTKLRIRVLLDQIFREQNGAFSKIITLKLCNEK